MNIYRHLRTFLVFSQIALIAGVTVISLPARTNELVNSTDLQCRGKFTIKHPSGRVVVTDESETGSIEIYRMDDGSTKVEFTIPGLGVPGVNRSGKWHASPTQYWATYTGSNSTSSHSLNRSTGEYRTETVITGSWGVREQTHQGTCEKAGPAKF